MDRQRRHALTYLALIVGVIAFYTAAYWWGMRALEGEPRSVLDAVNVVVQTFTTVGYGEDAPWTTVPMDVLMILMQLSGIFLVFMALPLFGVPWLEQRLSVEAPTSVDLTDHVVICGTSTRQETLTEELDAQDIPHVVVERNAERARERHERGESVVHGDPETSEALRSAGVPRASAVVIDAGDEANAAIALSVREVAPEVRLVGVVENPDVVEYLEYAGVDEVISPRGLLGRSLADKMTSAVTSQLEDTVEVGEHFEIVEVPVQRGSALDGVRLGESNIRERTGANVIGAWFAGEFRPSPAPEQYVDRSTVLLVAGDEHQLERLTALARVTQHHHEREHVVIAGYGEVGSTVRDVIDGTSIDSTVIDLEDRRGVDVVGDVTSESTLREADIKSASALVIAIGDDTTTIFATLVARELSRDIEIVTRANRTESVPKLYSAGADYVLALSTVTGRMLVSTVLDEDVVSLNTQIQVVRCQAPALAGETLAGADIRSRTGVTVIAAERNGEVVTDLGPDYRIRPEDALVVAGDDEAIIRFNDLAGVHATPS